ncbi:unnamed protein product [Cuscuta campestris]|uniref:F-box domain-containing protein n=1 Tax=Cuscuta campestris TaxID=132261 RepID=A0A484NDU3_9ASTE|nr:unnamed protein product [Cuscuta campestris]
MGGGDKIIMDPKIWSLMPKDLIERVFSFLPLKTLLSFRSTCKHFHSLLSSPPFLTNFSRSSPSSPSLPSFFLLSHPQFSRKYPLFDPAHDRWGSLTLPSPVLLSSAAGLLCFSLPNSHGDSFLVSNLLTNTSRVVEFPILPFHPDSLTLVPAPAGNYSIFVIDSSRSPWKSTFLYDSSRRSWRKFQDFKPTLSNCINHHQEGVLHRGSLYFVTPEPFRVFLFDLAAGEWRRSGMDLPAEDLTFARLVSDGAGKMYMIGGVGTEGISRKVKLWEREEGDGGGGGSWVGLEDVPGMMGRKLGSVCYHNYEHVYCFWQEGVVCVCCYTWPEILYFKVSRKTWHWLSRCPSLPDKWSCGFKWFSFVPNLCSFV